MTDIYKSIYNSILLVVNRAIKDAGFTRYITGKIVSVNGNKATVQIQDSTLTYPIRPGLSLVVGNVVYICLPYGNMSHGFVDCLRVE